MVREHWRDISLLAESLGIESRNWSRPPWEDKWNGLPFTLLSMMWGRSALESQLGN